MRGGGNEGTVQAGEAERRSVLPRGQRWALLALLLCIYVHNQWSRNSMLYAVLPNLEIAPNLAYALAAPTESASLDAVQVNFSAPASASREFLNVALSIDPKQCASRATVLGEGGRHACN
jgi:hypothetical protein